LESW